jgi:hypothetical protein
MFFQYVFFYYSVSEIEGCVSISGTKPACDRLDSGKLFEIWVVITFVTNNRFSNVVHISNEKHISNPPNTQKRFVCTILSELERLANNAFSARQNAFLVHRQNLLKQITGKFPVVFYLLFWSSKREQCYYFRYHTRMDSTRLD